MLTNSCVKLQTVHTIPMTMNKEGMFGKIIPSFSNIYIYIQFVLYLELCSPQMMNHPACTAS